MINQVRHTGIVVQNIKNVEKFYCSLGFIKSEQSFEEGSFIDNVVGRQNTKLEWVKLMAPDGYKIELLQYYTHSEKKKITKSQTKIKSPVKKSASSIKKTNKSSVKTKTKAKKVSKK